MKINRVHYYHKYLLGKRFVRGIDKLERSMVTHTFLPVFEYRVAALKPTVINQIFLKNIVKPPFPKERPPFLQ